MKLHVLPRAAHPGLQDQPAISTRVQARESLQYALALGAILALAAMLRFFRLDQQGFGNLYYAAAVKSMLTSIHNFFFVAFDPAGFLAVDKPPLGLWIQGASVALFGWSGWSLLAPQALAGLLSVALLAHLVQRAFGPVAALLAALTLALMPVSMAADRNNTIDSLLVLALLGAAWAVSIAAETGHRRPLLLGAALVGLGFTIKMAQALLVAPAFVLLYLAAAPLTRRQKLAQLCGAGLVLLAVAAPWPLIVDLTPASQRPFIASSSNSELDLILGHNGAARLMSNPLDGPQQPTAYVTDEIGLPGPLRLLGAQLGGQASWLLPLAACGLLAIGLSAGRASRQWQQALLWGIWLATDVAVFSAGHKFHRYYLVMVGPALAALVGAGTVALWRAYRRPGRRSWLLPLALLVTLAVQVVILRGAAAWSQILTPVVVGLGLIATAGLVAARPNRPALQGWAAGATLTGLLALLIAPAAWSITPLWGADANYPFAGPDLWTARYQAGSAPHVRQLADYLAARQGQARFLAATIGARAAAPLILETGQPVMALGGYSGYDHILTLRQFAAHIAAGDVRFVLLPTNQHPPQEELIHWVHASCTPVPPLALNAQDRLQVSDEQDVTYQIFDCAPQHS